MSDARDPNGPLKIAYLTYRGKPHVGGQGVYTRHLTKALVDLGHSVEVFGGQDQERKHLGLSGVLGA